MSRYFIKVKAFGAKASITLAYRPRRRKSPSATGPVWAGRLPTTISRRKKPMQLAAVNESVDRAIIRLHALRLTLDEPEDLLLARTQLEAIQQHLDDLHNLIQPEHQLTRCQLIA